MSYSSRQSASARPAGQGAGWFKCLCCVNGKIMCRFHHFPAAAVLLFTLPATSFCCQGHLFAIQRDPHPADTRKFKICFLAAVPASPVRHLPDSV